MIECYSDDNTPIKPFELMNIENEQEISKENHNKITVCILVV